MKNTYILFGIFMVVTAMAILFNPLNNPSTSETTLNSSVTSFPEVTTAPASPSDNSVLEENTTNDESNLDSDVEAASEALEGALDSSF